MAATLGSRPGCASELDPAVRSTLAIADAYPNFSIYGIPYWLSGEVTEKEGLAHRTRNDLERAGLDRQRRLESRFQPKRDRIAGLGRRYGQLTGTRRSPRPQLVRKD